MTRERSRPPGAAVVGIVLAVALAFGGGFLRAINAEPADRAAEIAGAAAFSIVFAAPALLAFLGLRDRPALLVAAGVLELGLAFISLFSIGLLFVVPAVLFFVAAGNMRGAGTRLWRSIAAVLVSITFGTVAFLALFARDDPVCWTTNATGETVRVDPDEFVQRSSISIEAPPGVSAAGCSSDSISTPRPSRRSPAWPRWPERPGCSRSPRWLASHPWQSRASDRRRPPLVMIDDPELTDVVALVLFAAAGSASPGPNNTLLLASGVRFGFGRTLRYVIGSAIGIGALIVLVGWGSARRSRRSPRRSSCSRSRGRRTSSTSRTGSRGRRAWPEPARPRSPPRCSVPKTISLQSRSRRPPPITRRRESAP